MVHMNIHVSKFVRSHIFFFNLPACRSIEVYLFYISHIYFLVIIYFFSIPKIVEIVLTGYCLHEYPVAWSILGDREFPRDR